MTMTAEDQAPAEQDGPDQLDEGGDPTRVYGPDPKDVGWWILIDSSWRLAALARVRAAKFGRIGATVLRGFGLVLVGLIVIELMLPEPVAPAPVDRAYAERVKGGIELARAVNRVVVGYYDAPDIVGRLAYVCEPERVRPLMEDHYAFHPWAIRKVEKVEVHATVMRFNTRHSHLFASVTDADNKVSVIILRREESGLKVDWEALEAYSPLGIANVIRLHSCGDTSLRVMARPSDYYNFEFADRDVWQAFVLWNPNDPDVLLHGYCRRDTEVGRELLALTAGRNSVAVRLAVGFSPAANGDNVVEIRRIEAPHWLGGDA